MPSGVATIVIADGAVSVRRTDGQTTPVGTVDEWLATATHGSQPRLAAALSGASGVHIQAPGGTPWAVVRSALSTTRQAQIDPIWLSEDGTELFGPTVSPRGRLVGSCDDGPAQVTGVDTRFTIEIQRGPDGTWAMASAIFRPRLDDGLGADGLPDRCWGAVSCDIAPVPEECAAAPEGFPDRVRLGDEHGCFLPIAKTDGAIPEWRAAIGLRLHAWGVAVDADTNLVPEARAPYSAVLATLGAYRDRGLRMPVVSSTLVQGNDGAPVCNAAVSDAATLAAAGSAWLGSRLLP